MKNKPNFFLLWKFFNVNKQKKGTRKSFKNLEKKGEF